MLIREKACGEEIDAILASSQPPLVTTLSSFAALEKSQRENLANYLAKLAWPLLTRNLLMYCYSPYRFRYRRAVHLQARCALARKVESLIF